MAGSLYTLETGAVPGQILVVLAALTNDLLVSFVQVAAQPVVEFTSYAVVIDFDC